LISSSLSNKSKIGFPSLKSSFLINPSLIWSSEDNWIKTLPKITCWSIPSMINNSVFPKAVSLNEVESIHWILELFENTICLRLICLAKALP